MNHAFAKLHPAVSFSFFVAAIVLSMFFMHPLFLGISFLMALACLLSLRGTGALKTLRWIFTLIIIVAFLNPILNTRGQTVLFTYFGGRPFMLESLCYGLALAILFATVIIWFSCYSEVVTKEKFTYLFGKIAPAFTMVFTMVMRLIPNYTRKSTEIRDARKGIGKRGEKASKKTQISEASNSLTVLAAWAFEDSLEKADSMKARGFGEGRRTCYARYKMSAFDWAVLLIMFACVLVVVCAAIAGTMQATYLPTFNVSNLSVLCAVAAAAYFFLLAIPFGLQVWEVASWRYLKSKI